MKAHHKNGTANKAEDTEQTVYDTIKAQFVAGLHACANSEGSLTDVVIDAIDNEIETAEMVAWGVEAGYSEAWVRTLISRVRVKSGKRIRKAGAGRKAPVDAKSYADKAVKQFGSAEKAAKILLAAYRLLKKQSEADTEEDTPEVITPRFDTPRITPEAERLIAKSGNGKH